MSAGPRALLQALAAEHTHTPRRPEDELLGQPVASDDPRLAQLVEALDYAVAAYRRDKLAVAANCRMKVGWRAGGGSMWCDAWGASRGRCSRLGGAGVCCVRAAA